MGKRPEGNGWNDVQKHDARLLCSVCGNPAQIRAKQHKQDSDRVTLWSEEHGFLEVVLRYCRRCDPNLAAIFDGKGKG